MLGVANITYDHDKFLLLYLTRCNVTFPCAQGPAGVADGTDGWISRSFRRDCTSRNITEERILLWHEHGADAWQHRPTLELPSICSLFVTNVEITEDLIRKICEAIPQKLRTPYLNALN